MNPVRSAHSPTSKTLRLVFYWLVALCLVGGFTFAVRRGARPLNDYLAASLPKLYQKWHLPAWLPYGESFLQSDTCSLVYLFRPLVHGEDCRPQNLYPQNPCE